MLSGGCTSQDDQEKLSPKPPQEVTSINPIDIVLPEYPSRYWELEMEETISKLQPAEKELLIKFVNRHIKLEPTIDQIPIPKGITLKQAIFTQKLIDAESAKLKQEIDGLKAQIQKQQEEIYVSKEMELKYKNALSSSMNGQNTSFSKHSGDTELKNRNQNNQALQEAYLRYGVSELETQLKVSMQKDRQDKRWDQFQSDSQTTQEIRDRLLAARLAAERSMSFGQSVR